MASYIDQNIYIVPSFTLECGAVLKNVPVAYKTWGILNNAKDNVMIICHAFTGSADVEDWWGPLMGRGKAFDPKRYFIFCANVLGSPYGTASPITLDPQINKPYGPGFPPTSIRDDVWLHRLVLNHLNVRSVAVVIGGSMGGMAVLEWPLCTPAGYVRHIVPLATSARHSAWCISWGEAQRQSIYSDPSYGDGYYESQPASGLAAARMSALLTYRSRDSFESRFGRKPQLNKPESSGLERLTPPESPRAKHSALHNDGHRNAKPQTVSSTPSTENNPQFAFPMVSPVTSTFRPPVFSAQSYLRYQGEKFVARFDANCYIHITRKMDTHDLARGRGFGWAPPPASELTSTSVLETEIMAPSLDVCPDPSPGLLEYVLSLLPSRALVISIESDGLFTPSEQREIAAHIPNAKLVVIRSPDGHDGFLLEFEAINSHILRFLKESLPEYYGEGSPEHGTEEGFEVKKNSVFGEAEVDVAMW